MRGKLSNNNGWRFGINLGITYSNTIGKGTVENSMIIGEPPDCYTNSSAASGFILGKKFGIGIVNSINKTFSLSLDVNYEEKGCKIPLTEISYLESIQGPYILNNQKSNIRLKYISLPLKLETKFDWFYIKTGIYVGVLVDADDYGELRINDQKIKFERDKDGRYSKFDLGGIIGAGISIPLSKIDFLKFGLNGQWNILGNDPQYVSPEYWKHWYNQSFSLEIRFEREI